MADRLKKDEVYYGGAPDLAPPIMKEDTPPVSKPNFNLGGYFDSFMGSINSAKDAVSNQINAAYDQLIQSTAAQKGEVRKQADSTFRDVYANARVSAINHNEQLAAMGLARGNGQNASSGYSETSRVRQDTAMQNNLTSVANTRDSNLAAIDQQINALNAQRAKELAAIESQYSAQSLQAMQHAAQMEFNYYTWQQEFDYGKLQDAQAQQNWQNQFDYQQWQDMQAQQNWQTKFDYDKSQDALNQKNWQTKFDYDKRQDALNQKNWQTKFDYDKRQDALKQKNWQTKFDYDKQQDALNQQNWLDKFNYQKQQDAQAQKNWYANYLLKQRPKKSYGGGGSSASNRGKSGKSDKPDKSRLSPEQIQKLAGQYDAQEAKFQEYLRFAGSVASFQDGEAYASYFDQLYRQTDITEDQYYRALHAKGYPDRVIKLRLNLM